MRVSDPFRFDLARLNGEAGGDPIGDLRLAGADEAGRGCLAGPLVAAAVVLDYDSAPFPALAGITDSKLLSSAEREALYPGILQAAVRVSWVSRSPSTIDRVGLHRCNLAGVVPGVGDSGRRIRPRLGGRFRSEAARPRGQRRYRGRLQERGGGCGFRGGEGSARPAHEGSSPPAPAVRF